MISTVEKVLFLKSIDLFRALPSEELAQIAEIAEEQPLAAGDRVGIWAPNCAEWVLVQFATAKAGIRSQPFCSAARRTAAMRWRTATSCVSRLPEMT